MLLTGSFVQNSGATSIVVSFSSPSSLYVAMVHTRFILTVIWLIRYEAIYRDSKKYFPNHFFLKPISRLYTKNKNLNLPFDFEPIDYMRLFMSCSS
jgi:hypothetical protein